MMQIEAFCCCCVRSHLFAATVASNLLGEAISSRNILSQTTMEVSVATVTTADSALAATT